MPRIRFAVEFEDAEGAVVCAFSGIPAQTKQEAIAKATDYLNTLTPTAIKEPSPLSLAEAITATLNASFGTWAAASEAEDAGDAAEQTKDAAPASKRKAKATKASKRKAK